MTSHQIREQFLQFFADKGHQIVPSAPIVVKNDPTLMFNNAGMNQFKDLFIGNSEIKHPRIVNSQKCLRVSGKHNDLEEVGVDTYHHTMFEMLGNWSFGDYFKKEAIAWAWELLTEVYGIEKDRLYITVFGGDQKDKLDMDVEAYDYWKTLIPEDRILSGSKKDNFWEMGESGPCGPCSEIHVDVRSDEERKKIDGHMLVNMDHPQVVEVWNLVFMQYSRMANGELKPLPAKHVDTGMGFERLCMVLQAKQSNYDTDVFSALIKEVENASGLSYQQSDSKEDVAMRVIADHVRAVAFAISDGQLPSNTGAGYVIRRILRRAIRYYFSVLNISEPLVVKLVDVLNNQLKTVFPELNKQLTLVKNVILEEENSFLKTLDKGIAKIEGSLDQIKNKEMSGKMAFELFDTFGFPFDLTALILKEKGLSVNEADFNTALQLQKERSRKATASSAGDWIVVHEDEVEEFIGYDYLSAEVKIARYRAVDQKGKKLFQLVFNVSPFYPEGGGQVGDTGYLESNGEKTYIVNTLKENNLIIHISEKLPSNVNDDFKAYVNQLKRQQTACNHSATHLLHEALRETLGTHVEQKGSLVNEHHLRFDFSHFSKVSDEELIGLENLVNARIRENIQLIEKRDTPISEAEKMGAMALFGEKYGDVVRVIKFGSSVELCGGTHVSATGQLGIFKFTAESSVAAGIRRIEAVTGQKALDLLNAEAAKAKAIGELTKSPKDPVKAVEKLMQDNQQLNRELESLRALRAKGIKEELKHKIVSVGNVKMLAEEVQLDNASIKDLAFQLSSEIDDLFLALANQTDGKATITVALNDNLLKKDFHAGNIIRELAKEIGGGGGGQAAYATAGGKNPSGISKALDRAREFVK
ncbi:MAG: alanyl-tRNA synthetase [Flavobacteriales bacterium]|jgi:alanyl-tRNA synthetase